MKKLYYIIYIVGILLMNNCTTPYSHLAKIDTMKDLAYPFPTKSVALEQSGYNISYIEMGKGEKTILFIHGLGSYAPAWTKNIEELSKNYRCIAIDLPGYGKSDKFPHSGKMSFYAGIVNEFVETLNLGQVYLTGHSMGGQISLTTAIFYPDIVKGLILVAPAGFEPFTAGQKEWFKDVMTPKGVKLTTAEAIINNLATNFYTVPDDADFMITDRLVMRSTPDFDAYCYAVAQSVYGMVDEPVLDYLQFIKVPTLILFGENDNLIPNRYLNPGRTVDIAKNGADKIANSKLVMVPKCGHFLMFEKPEVYNQEVKIFLQ